uniref:Peptidase_M1 domain-containing protein n=1 Tax=Parastrongyloides trichosuri TaxID=131310 RepID=A0A0N4Z087_PARTI
MKYSASLAHLADPIITSSYTGIPTYGEAIHYRISGTIINGTTRVSVYTVKSHAKRGTFGLEGGIAVVNYLSKYLNMKYHLTKMDMLAAPVFEYGAMENTRLLISSARTLLFDVNTTDIRGKMKGIASIVAHEVVHQLFGNIITMDWWNQL